MYLNRYRTPLCIFFPPRIVAAACFILAQRAAEGPHSPSLDARISASPPSASLPTPPSHKPGSPDASRFAIGYFGFSELELQNLAGQRAIFRFGSMGSSRPSRCSQYNARILLGPGSTDYLTCFLTYVGQFSQEPSDTLSDPEQITPPAHSPRPKLYEPFSQLLPAAPTVVHNSSLTPESFHGSTSPSMTPSQSHVMKTTLEAQHKAPRLDLS